MKRMMALAWLTLLASAPLHAQDETPPADASAEAAAADTAVADDTAADASAAGASATDAASGDDASADTTAADESTDSSYESSDASYASSESTESSDESTETAEAESILPPLYIGVEYDTSKIEINKESKQAQFGGSRRYSSDFYKLRLGARLFEVVGVEVQAGFPNRSGDVEDRDLKTKSFYGAYIVPTGVLFDLLEVSARLGYSVAKYSAGGASESIDGASYGIAVELPLRSFGETLPNFRLTAGGTVYQQANDERVYGWHGGLRYDFNL